MSKKDINLTRDERAKKQKTKKILLFVGGGIALVVIVVIIIAIVAISSLSKKFKQGAEVVQMEASDIESSFTITGTIQSDKSQDFTTPSAILVDEAVKVGTFVKAGDPIVVFDKCSFDDAYTIAELQDTISMNSYMSSMEKMDEAKTKLAAAKADVTKYTGLVNTQQKTVDDLKAGMSDSDQRIAELQSKISIASAEYKEYSLYSEPLNTLSGIPGESPYQMSQTAMETYKTYADQKAAEIAQASRELAALQSGMTNVNQTNALAEANTKLAEYKAELEKAKTKVETYESVAGTSFDQENVVLNGEITKLQVGKGTEVLDDYTDGIVRAPFDGVVTAVTATAGNYTAPNAAFAQFASLDDVSLLVNLSKKDLENLDIGDSASIKILDRNYDGVVSQVNRVATVSTNGATSIGAIVDITNPDELIFLGLDGKAKITTADETGVNSIPIEALNSDNDGDFVYVVDNMMVVSKKYIETGISSTDRIEVVSGLDASDWVVVSYTTEPIEGEPLIVNTPEYLETIGK